MVGVKLPEAERRANILIAARSIALRDGIGAVSGRSVASEAGLSSGLVYFYFETKERLLLGLLEQLIAEALDGPPVGFGHDLDPDTALYRMLEHELSDLVQLRGVIDLLFQFYFLRRDAFFRDCIADGFTRYGESMFAVVVRYAESHSLDPERLRYLIVTLIEGAAVEIVRRPEEFDAERMLSMLRTLPALAAVG